MNTDKEKILGVQGMIMKRFMISFSAVVRKSTFEKVHYVSHVDVDIEDDYKIVDYKSLSKKADPVIVKNIEDTFGESALEVAYHIVSFSRYED